MAFENLLRLQAYLRGDGRNEMAEAIKQRGARQRQLEDREQHRLDVFESQRRAQEFQREQSDSAHSFQERLVEKQNDAYLSRLKKIQEMKLQSSFPKKPGETDEQWEERVGKTQAEAVNRFFEDASDARKRAGEILKEQAKRKQGEVLKHARMDSGFLSMVEALDARTAKAIRGGTPPEAAIQELAKRSEDKASQALAAYEQTLGKYAGTDDRGIPLVPDATPQAIDEYNSLKEAEKLASEQATLLINTYQRDGDFKGAPYLKSIARELLGPRVTPPSPGDSEGGLKPEDFRPKKTSPGGSAGVGAKPPIGSGAGSGGNAERGTGNAEWGEPFRLPGRGVVPTFLNEALPPIEEGAAEALRRAGVVGRNIRTTAAAPYRYWFSGEPINYEGMEDTEQTIHQALPMSMPLPPPRTGIFTPGGAEGVSGVRNPKTGLMLETVETYRGGASGSWDAARSTPPLAMNVSANELHDYFLNALGMTPEQIDEHEEEKAQGNPEAISSEREILSEIMRRRAMLPPMEPVEMR